MPIPLYVYLKLQALRGIKKAFTMHKTKEDLVLEQGIDNKPLGGFIKKHCKSIQDSPCDTGLFSGRR